VGEMTQFGIGLKAGCLFLMPLRGNTGVGIALKNTKNKKFHRFEAGMLLKIKHCPKTPNV
jgi:hypothetical protein